MYIGVTNYPDFLKTQSIQTSTAGQTVFTGLNYDPGNVEIYKNGLRQLPSQYSAPNGTTLTLYTPTVLGDKIDVVSREENAVGSDVVSVNGKTGVVVLDHYDFPDMPWLDGTGRIPSSLLPTSIVGAVVYQGTWNASSGAAPSASPAKGHYWVASVAGNTDLSGNNVWYAGDIAIYNGTDWDRVDGSANEVLSVNGHTGVVVLNASDIASSLGFTPVQQGTGIGQTTNTVKIGWSPSGLKATVDVTDIGHIVIADNAGRVHADGSASTLLLGSNKGLIEVREDNAFYGPQYLRLRAEPSLYGSPYGEFLLGTNGQNFISGNTNLSGGAVTITPLPGDNSTKVATTAFVQNTIAGIDTSDKVNVAGDTMTDSLTILGAGTGIGATQNRVASSVVGAAGWVNPSNILGSTNGSYTTNSISAIDQTGAIDLLISSFSIPVNATITGISVRIQNFVSGNDVPVWLTASLTLPGSSVVYEQAQFLSSPGLITFGGSSSQWGYNLTPALVNGLFGVHIYAYTDNWAVDPNVISIDSVEVIVHYVELGVTSGTLFLGNSTNAKLQYDGTKYNLPNADLYVNGAKALTTSGGVMTGPLSISTGNVIGTNAVGTKYVSTSAPSGGNDGDIWYRYSL